MFKPEGLMSDKRIILGRRWEGKEEGEKLEGLIGFYSKLTVSVMGSLL